MAVECPFCQTANRDSAKFCKSCGGKLVAFPPASMPDEHTVIVAPSLRPPAPIQPPAFPDEPPAASRARWPLIAMIAVGVLVAAGAGGYLYLRGDGAVPPSTSPTVAAASASESGVTANPAPESAVVASAGPVPLGIPADPAAVPSMPPPPEPATPAPPVISARTVLDASPAASPPPSPSTPPKPRKTTAVRPTAAAPVAAPEEPPPAPAPPPPAPVAPPPPAEPRTACAGRNFVATAQCMAAQCVKPEFRSHPQCEAVRRQQRLEEERRNPTMMN